MQRGHSGTTSSVCYFPGHSGNAKVGVVLTGKFRRIAYCRKRGGSEDVEAWSHSIWLWVFKTVPRGTSGKLWGGRD